MIDNKIVFEGMTEQQLMDWYKKWWSKTYPEPASCELDTIKTKKYPEPRIVLRTINVKGEKNVRYVHDAIHAWKKAHGIENKELNLKVKLPFNKPKTKKEFKTVGCNIDLEFYNKVKKVCDSHNMTMHELIKTLLKQVVSE